MSSVTGVVLQTSCAENTKLIDEINKWLRFGYGCGAASPRPWSLVDTSSFAGGHKHPGLRVLVGGFSGFSSTDKRFRNFVLNLPWFSPEQVVLIITYEDGASQVYRPDGQ
jgi:hypothetical protein